MRHSESIQRVKSVKESMKGRWTDQQMMSTLDHLLKLAVEPIIRYTKFLDYQIPAIIHWYATNTGRKIAMTDKQRTLYFLNLWFMFPPEEKVKLWRKIKFERNIAFFLCSQFLALTEGYIDLEFQQAVNPTEEKAEDLHRIEQGVGASDNLGRIVQTVRMWTQQAARFRNQILERFMRHAMMQAYKYHLGNPRSNFDDVCQNFLMAVNKAVNKLDPDKGTLTSYANRWITNAKHSPVVPHEYGISYSLSPHIKRAVAKGDSQLMNISTDLSSEEVELAKYEHDIVDQLERNDQILQVRKLAKIADPLGFARRELGIEEYLYPYEAAMIRKIEDSVPGLSNTI
jgi:hypothetical protein